MAEQNAKTTVTLEVNGEQAKKTLEGLKKMAVDVRKEMDNAAMAGDRITYNKLDKELTRTRKQIQAMESTAAHMEKVLANLGKATPNELQKTLSYLKRNLSYIERGTKEWDEQVAKIKAVKTEIKVMNDSMRESRSLTQRITDTVNNWAGTFAAAALSVSGVVAAGRKAVQAYAEMDQEMANVRKYTGMTEKQVRSLNESFKEIDTRSSRVELNKLAQEAGRLGLKSKEDVLGFVKAADIINVALDELGEGATQELSKLTDIFGVNKEYGVEDSLLKVGSVINELSQNSTASASYLNEFAQRMAGVGKVANMTVPQIMGFAAVLDANGQNLEVAASSLSKLTMDMFQNTGKIAKAVGLNVEKFADMAKNDANKALLVLLSRLKELGGIDTLAPMFAEMGESGVRMSAVLSTLVANVDQVRIQQKAANEAFAEGTSVTQEFNVQNNTVQAGLDKAKKDFNELAVSLGEKLVPIMSSVISKTSAILKILNVTLDFIGKHKTAILMATAAVVGYTAAVNAAAIKDKVYAVAAKAAEIAQKGFNAAMSANTIGLLVAALSAAIAYLVDWTEQAKKSAEEMAMVTKANEEASTAYEKQEAKIKTLVSTANNENLSLKARKKAIEELNKIVPGYNAELIATTGHVIATNDALERYLQNLRRQIKLQAYATNMQKAMDKQIELEAKKARMTREGADSDDIKEVERQIQDLKGDYAYFERTIESINQEVDRTWKKQYNEVKTSTERMLKYVQERQLSGEITTEASRSRQKVLWENYLKDIRNIQNIDQELVRQEEEKYQRYFKKEIEAENALKKKRESTQNKKKSDGSSSSSAAKKPSENPELKKLKEERQAEEAELLAKFASRKLTLTSYNEEMLKILDDYYKKALRITTLSEDERDKITRERDTARVERVKANAKTEHEARLREIESELVDLQEAYAMGDVTRQEFELKSHEITIRMMRENNEYAKQWGGNLVDIDSQLQQWQNEALERNRDLKAEMLHDVFGVGTAQDKADYDQQLSALEQVRAEMLIGAGNDEARRRQIIESSELAILELKRKYYQIDEKNYQKSLDKIQNKHKKFFAWLNSEEGQVVMSSADTVISGMTNMFSQLNSLMQAEVDAQTAVIESNYEVLTSRAEGNKYMEVELERQKEQEIAEIKNNASRKMYGMQVAQAIAEGAMAAINAYQSAAAIPIVGFVLGPIAAAAAAAATGIQIATIKKQQEAANSSGYAEGGFTKPGRKYEEAGIVHAGEWVASQELVNSPVARPIINSLEMAQRTNTIASLDSRDVSDTLTAPRHIAKAMSGGNDSSATLAATMALLTRRLNEPFVTVNTVTGDRGINKAIKDYDKLMKNK